MGLYEKFGNKFSNIEFVSFGKSLLAGFFLWEKRKQMPSIKEGMVIIVDFLKTGKGWAKSVLPKRPEDSNKGTFGRLFAYVGSRTYIGAALLCLESALRGGAGYVELCSEISVWESVVLRFPEIVYREAPPTELLGEKDIKAVIEAEKRSTATLIGCGGGRSENLCKLVLALLSSEGAPLIIDADAINSLAQDRENSVNALANSKRRVIITPHPLEFSRISGIPVDEISNNRQRAAEAFAKRASVIVLLKGSGTVITDGEKTYINTSGSSALAKAGSGDCLGGLLASLVASGGDSLLELSALAAYIHGKAADNLSSEFSRFGVTPSDLPKEMAKVIKTIE